MKHDYDDYYYRRYHGNPVRMGQIDFEYEDDIAENCSDLRYVLDKMRRRSCQFWDGRFFRCMIRRIDPRTRNARPTFDIRVTINLDNCPPDAIYPSPVFHVVYVPGRYVRLLDGGDPAHDRLISLREFILALAIYKKMFEATVKESANKARLTLFNLQNLAKQMEAAK